MRKTLYLGIALIILLSNTIYAMSPAKIKKRIYEIADSCIPTYCTQRIKTELRDNVDTGESNLLFTMFCKERKLETYECKEIIKSLLVKLKDNNLLDSIDSYLFTFTYKGGELYGHMYGINAQTKINFDNFDASFSYIDENKDTPIRR